MARSTSSGAVTVSRPTKSGLVMKTGNRSHPVEERGVDLYETPRVAVLALLDVERVPLKVWEPACGPGAIVSVLRERRRDVLATDLVDYRSPHQNRAGVDFLSPAASRIARQGRAIVTNPPFMHAPEFVRRALSFSPYVAMLLRFAFATGTTRSDIIDGAPLSKIYVFSKRLPMMHRDGWTGRKAGSGMDFAWFIWKRDHNGPPELHRLLWTRYA